MPALLAPYVIAALLGFGGGFALSHQLDALQYNDLKAAFSRANAEAAAQLAKAQQQTLEAEQKTIETNRQLDNAHDSFITTANALHDQLATARLRDTGRRPGCANAVPVAASTSQPQAETTDDAELSAELAEFLKSEAYRADQLAAYAEICYRYINEQGG